MIKSYKDLKVWEAGMEMAVAVYRATGQFPKPEVFGLVSQMRRAASSVPANIAEGFSRQHKTEFTQYLHIAAGSLSELRTHLCLSERLGFLGSEEAALLEEQADAIGRMLHGLIRTLRKYQPTKPGRRPTDD